MQGRERKGFTVNNIGKVLLVGAAVAAATPGFAADLSATQGPSMPAASPAPAAILNTFTFEFSPEFGATDNVLKDDAFKLGYSRSLGHGWSWGLSDQEVVRSDGKVGNTQNVLETTLGYGLKLSDMFTLPLSVGVGYVFDTRNASSELTEKDWAYYVLNAGLNVKLGSHWTWNAVSARYRNAFEGGWETPKVSTGITYTIDPLDAIYANVGYSWKNSVSDKWSIAFGYKRGF